MIFNYCKQLLKRCEEKYPDQFNFYDETDIKRCVNVYGLKYKEHMFNPGMYNYNSELLFEIYSCKPHKNTFNEKYKMKSENKNETSAKNLEKKQEFSNIKHTKNNIIGKKENEPDQNLNLELYLYNKKIKESQDYSSKTINPQHFYNDKMYHMSINNDIEHTFINDNSIEPLKSKYCYNSKNNLRFCPENHKFQINQINSNFTFDHNNIHPSLIQMKQTKNYVFHNNNFINLDQKKTSPNVSYIFKKNSIYKFSCNIDNCLLKFTSKGGLKYHTEKYHDKSNLNISRPYICQVIDCGKHFKSKPGIKNHYESKHNLNVSYKEIENFLEN